MSDLLFVSMIALSAASSGYLLASAVYMHRIEALQRQLERLTDRDAKGRFVRRDD